MANIMRHYHIDETSYPIDGVYTHDAKVFLSVDGGENFYYCGIGRFCKSRDEAEAWCAEYERKHSEEVNA